MGSFTDLVHSRSGTKCFKGRLIFKISLSDPLICSTSGKLGLSLH